jgi:hypothetical protein
LRYPYRAKHIISHIFVFCKSFFATFASLT